jgi:hypothetical protein
MSIDMFPDPAVEHIIDSQRDLAAHERAPHTDYCSDTPGECTHMRTSVREPVTHLFYATSHLTACWSRPSLDDQLTQDPEYATCPECVRYSQKNRGE